MLISERFFEFKNQSYFALHKVKNQLVIEEVKGKTANIYFDNSVLAPKELEVAMGNYWAKRNIVTVKFRILS